MKKILPLLILVLLALGSFAQECRNYFPIASPDGNYLYFTSSRENDVYKIFRSNIDGSNPVRVTTTDFAELHHRLSPDGTRLVFQAGQYEAGTEIYVINVDGTNLTRLTENSIYDGNPCFSPDGTKIVFDAWDGSAYPEVFIMNADGTGRTQLTNVAGAYWQTAPVFHPSGNKIYFQEGFNADNHIMRMDIDGSNWEEITPANEFGYSESYLNFNPDGSKMLFTTSEWAGYGGPFDIVVSDADGSNWQRLTFGPDGEKNSYSACFSSNGSMIYYANDELNSTNYWDIFAMTHTGANKVSIVSCSDLGLEEPSSSTGVLQCVPNPLSGKGLIKVKLNDPENITVKFFDFSGKTVNVDFTVSSDGINISKGALSSGIYFMSIIAGDDFSSNCKIIVQ